MKAGCVLVCIVSVAWAALPNLPDCRPAQTTPFSTANPANFFSTSREIGNKATPKRTGNLRNNGPLPTGHFATNHIKNDQIWPMILIPYQTLLTTEGAAYDTYLMNWWSDPERSNYMEQQSASEAGKPWNKLNDMGSNMRQMTSAPDGNPQSGFSGKSGLRVSIAGAGEPEMTSFGELYANFRYSGNGGTMELPLVRGASMLTHILNNANPIVKPYCLTSINGQNTNFDCPTEPSAGGGGVGFLEGSCHGGQLEITLHNSKIIRDISKIQWSAETRSNWGRLFMRTCDSAHCRLVDGGKSVKITVPNASGRMAFAVNFIGHYLLPPDWSHKPEEVSCYGKRDESEVGGVAMNVTSDTKISQDPDLAEEENKQTRSISDIKVSASCSGGTVTMVVDVGPERVTASKIQVALQPASTWDDWRRQGFTPPMITCDSAHCVQQGHKIIITKQARANNFAFSINVIGKTLLAQGPNWMDQPFRGTCDGSCIVGNDCISGTPVNPGGGDGNPTSAPVTSAPVTQGPQTWTNAPIVTQAPPKPPTNLNINHNWVSGNINQANTKFVLEMKEPGEDMPGKTRKFILYFSSPVKANMDTGSGQITFSPANGGRYTGIMQIAYAGSSAKGDQAWNSFFDNNAGAYSYQPEVYYCVSESRNKAYVSFEWGTQGSGTLLMTAMPHQALLLKNGLKDTPFAFKGKEGSDWLMEYDVLHTDVAPDPAGVAAVKANGGQRADMLAAIARDAQNDYIDSYCSHTDSYNGGKGIGMSTRLASISRAFGTNHYQKTDESIRNCLEKWLRVQDSLDGMWKFKYDTVWGGLYLRATNNAEVEWGVDYGFPYYNDHHFHLGYFLYAMAYYVKHYPQWGQRHKERIYSLARDVGNPSIHDNYFPVSRQKDLYTGWSWASGLVPGTRQEESASEGINCYHGLAALGDAFNDKNMKQTGQVLLAMEIQSVREYWQVRDHNRAHFPPAIQKTGVVGMVTEPDFFAYTLNWPCDPNIFPQRHACLVGIQIIPITAVSKYWVDQEWAKSIQNSCETAINPQSAPDYGRAEKTSDFMRPLNSGWQAFCYAGMAPLDNSHKTRAANYVKGRKPQELVGGTGAASTLLFIYAST